MEHKVYKYKEERQEIWAKLLNSYPDSLVFSHSDWIIRILDKLYPED